MASSFPPLPQSVRDDVRTGLAKQIQVRLRKMGFGATKPTNCSDRSKGLVSTVRWSWHAVNHVQLQLREHYLVAFGWLFIQCFPTYSSQAHLGSGDSLDQLPLKHSHWFQPPFPCDPLWGKCEDQNNNHKMNYKPVNKITIHKSVPVIRREINGGEVMVPFCMRV